jgi:hypothetical protein
MNYQSHAITIIPNKVRWLALAAGCAFGVAGFFYAGLFSMIAACPLILGALVQPHLPRSGRLLISVGVLLSTLYGGFFLLPIVVSINRLRLHHDVRDLGFLSLFLVAVLLVGWSDVELIRDARRHRETSRTARHGFPRSEDWLLWIVASLMSLWVLPFVTRGLRDPVPGRWDIFGELLGLGLVVVLFDVALVIRAAKLWREQRSLTPESGKQ